MSERYGAPRTLAQQHSSGTHVAARSLFPLATGCGKPVAVRRSAIGAASVGVGVTAGLNDLTWSKLVGGVQELDRQKASLVVEPQDEFSGVFADSVLDMDGFGGAYGFLIRVQTEARDATALIHPKLHAGQVSPVRRGRRNPVLLSDRLSASDGRYPPYRASARPLLRKIVGFRWPPARSVSGTGGGLPLLPRGWLRLVAALVAGSRYGGSGNRYGRRMLR